MQTVGAWGAATVNPPSRGHDLPLHHVPAMQHCWQAGHVVGGNLPVDHPPRLTLPPTPCPYGLREIGLKFLY